MSTLLKIARTLAIGFALLFVATGLFLAWGMLMRVSKCEKGPLLSVSSCEIDHATFTWMSSGWWYTKATGRPDPNTCLQPATANCRDLLGASHYAKCSSSSRLSSNGNTTYYEITAWDDGCADALYFKGSKRTLSGGKVIEAKE